MKIIIGSSSLVTLTGLAVLVQTAGAMCQTDPPHLNAPLERHRLPDACLFNAPNSTIFETIINGKLIRLDCNLHEAAPSALNWFEPGQWIVLAW